MAVFKCKMCGAPLQISGETIIECGYCGATQTLPRITNDKVANMYERANSFRRNNEFDKAAEIYESILNENNTDSEAYWSLVLCRFGIEYVEDPVTSTRVPTVNRTQLTSIFDDYNYKCALQYGDMAQRPVYEKEAKTINDIQRSILEISKNEKPFDIFICYKETDENGERTHDSVLAQELYYQLQNEGFKVFFSRITLEDKLGVAYEPYIFAALNSSKVMVVVGTKPEYFDAVWVKNEWRRYLLYIRGGAKKTLIPAYKDMNPYDLPKEFSNLQAQDMSKLGFMQDLIRGIKKIVNEDKPKEQTANNVQANNEARNLEILITRAFLAAEDGNKEQIDRFVERIFEIDPKCGEAFLVQMMASYGIRRREDMGSLRIDYRQHPCFDKIMRFGSPELKKEVNHYLKGALELIMGDVYANAKHQMSIAKKPYQLVNAANIFSTISGFMDADEMRRICIEDAKKLKRKKTIISLIVWGIIIGVIIFLLIQNGII